MKNDPQTPRDWLLERHGSMKTRLDEIRRDALPAQPAPATRFNWKLFLPLATLGAAAVVIVTLATNRSVPTTNRAERQVARGRPSPATSGPTAPYPAPASGSAENVRAQNPAGGETYRGPQSTTTRVLRKMSLEELSSKDTVPTNPGTPVDIVQSLPKNKSSYATPIPSEPFKISGPSSGVPAPTFPSLSPAQIAANDVAPNQGPKKSDSTTTAPFSTSGPSSGVPAPTFPTLSPQQIAANDVAPLGVEKKPDLATEEKTKLATLIKNERDRRVAASVATERVELLSNGETYIQVQGAGVDATYDRKFRLDRMLGKFESQVVMLPPGDYEFIGRRKGYRDVVLRVTVARNAPTTQLTIACTDAGLASPGGAPGNGQP